jgi:hypothetical protein
MSNLIRRKTRIKREGESLCIDLFGRLEAVETEVSMEGTEDGALGLDALAMQPLSNLIKVSPLYSYYVSVIYTSRPR